MDPCYALKGPVILEDVLKPVFPPTFDDKALLLLLQSLTIQQAAFFDGYSVLETTHQCIFLWEGSWEWILAKDNDSISLPLRSWLLAFVESLTKSLSCASKGIIDADVFEGKLEHSHFVSICMKTFALCSCRRGFPRFRCILGRKLICRVCRITAEIYNS
jgi:hypothetical protein